MFAINNSTLQLEATITHICTRHLKGLVRNLTEREYLIVQHSMAQMKPLSVGATIDMFNGIGVYNKCIQQWILLYGYRYVAEIVNEQMQKAKNYLKAGNVVDAAELCVGIILGVQIKENYLDGEAHLLHQAKADACALVKDFPAKQRSDDEFCLITEVLHLLRTGVPIHMLLTKIKCINLVKRFVRKCLDKFYKTFPKLVDPNLD